MRATTDVDGIKHGRARLVGATTNADGIKHGRARLVGGNLHSADKSQLAEKHDILRSSDPHIFKN